MSVKYKRVLLKLSGEALSGDKGFGLDMDTIQTICKGIKDAHDLGAEIAIVVGGGNFWLRPLQRRDGAYPCGSDRYAGHGHECAGRG